MTADIELLPLPEADDSVENRAQWPIAVVSDVWLQKSVQDYARACVAHATVPLKAEIERLRAEVVHLTRTMEATAHLLESAVAEMDRRESRAERLTEALALLPDEIDMIENSPDEGMLMSCCGREVKSRGLHDLLITHDKGCWYVSMRALRYSDKEGGDA